MKIHHNSKNRNSDTLKNIATYPFKKHHEETTSKDFMYQHDEKKVREALKIMKYILEEDVIAVVYNGSNKEDVKRKLKEHLNDDFLETVSHVPLKENPHVSFIKNAKKNRKLIDKFSYGDAMIFILYLDYMDIVSFGETVSVTESLDNENIVAFSRVFSIPYHDWYLGLVLIYLEPPIQEAYLNILESPFMSSISLTPFLINFAVFNISVDMVYRCQLEKVS